MLPLKRGQKIALVGPLADNRENMPGTWAVAALFDKAISVREGLMQTGGSNTTIMHVRGSNLHDDSLYEERAGMFGKSLRRDSRTPDAMIAEAVAAM